MSKSKALRYLKVMIFKFCPAAHLILIFTRTILPPAELFELSKRQVSSQANVLPQFIWSQLWIWWDSFFLNFLFFLFQCWGTCLNEGTKKIQRGGDLPWMMPIMNLLQKGETGVIKLYQRRAFQKEISPMENETAITDQMSI